MTIRDHVTLLLPTGATTVPVQITYDDGEDAACTVKITLTYDGTPYEGSGAEYLWEDAFADLQDRLPQGVRIACCMTCRHGNMCPYGNVADQLFCTKEQGVTSKTELAELFDNTELFTEGAVRSTDHCDDFAYRSDEHYAYNDFLYFLKRKR